MSIGIGIGLSLGVRRAGGAAAPWWLSGGIDAANAVAVYQPIGAASLAASYSNLANPGVDDVTVVVAPPAFNTATGWQFNNAASGGGHLRTVSISDNYTVLIRYSDYVFSNDVYIYSADSNWRIRQTASPNTQYTHRNTTAVVAGALASGVIGMAGNQAYRDGVAVGAAISGASAISGVLNLGSSSWAPANKVQAWAIYNATLTADQVAAVSTAMSALT